jgi:hypothetical protein
MLNESGQSVISFASALRNASRVGTYADIVVSMFTSGIWRSYETAVGPARWRAHEFDYFLISCDAEYLDVQRILSWDTVRAAKLAEAMQGGPSRYRRSLQRASDEWQGMVDHRTLLDLARTRGWLHAQRDTLKDPPVPKRALQRQRTGMTWEVLAQRRRVQQLTHRQRATLDALGQRLLRRPAVEVLYLIEWLRRRVGVQNGTKPPTKSHTSNREMLGEQNGTKRSTHSHTSKTPNRVAP